MRGKRKFHQKILAVGRITPAHAGKTPEHCVPTVEGWDHPRACGENLDATMSYDTAPGITPAHAGKTEELIRGLSGCEDHPRACGENVIGGMIAVTIGGSPPRMRGKLHGRATKATYQRITPAHAGKTVEKSFLLSRVKDHPRACGENRRAGQFLRPQLGSPPRMRGKPT